ncbi:MAG: hypothetical protein WDO24_27325 [Pseudomonadota bacterium]
MVPSLRRVLAAFGGEQRRFRRALARQQRKIQLADELLATLSPQSLFLAGYSAHRLPRVRAVNRPSHMTRHIAP